MQTMGESFTQARTNVLKTPCKKNLYLENICLCPITDRQCRLHPQPWQVKALSSW